MVGYKLQAVRRHFGLNGEEAVGRLNSPIEEIRHLGLASEDAVGRLNSAIEQIRQSGLDGEEAVGRLKSAIAENRQLGFLNREEAVGRLNSAIAEIQSLEGEIRASYDEEIECDGETFAWMLTLDASFILQFFRFLQDENQHEPIFPNQHMPIFPTYMVQSFHSSLIVKDIFMLENQIPLSVLLKVLELEKPRPAENIKEQLLAIILEGDNRQDLLPLLEGSSHLLEFFYGIYSNAWDAPSRSTPQHRILTDDIWTAAIKKYNWTAMKKYIFKYLPITKKRDEDAITIRSAVVLNNAGIKFECYEGRDLTKIRFDKEKTTLFLPKFKIDDHTETMYRNFMIWEMFKGSSTEYILSSYAWLMDQLIDSEKDVSLLKKARIVENFLGSDQEVANMLNSLCKGIAVETTKYDETKSEIMEHYSNEYKVMVAEFVNQYFFKPWQAVSLMAAGLLLLMTFLQTFFTIYSVFHK
eukprot:Gb_12420 [translate_table: standard]